jgi:hypothetical protein
MTAAAATIQSTYTTTITTDSSTTLAVVYAGITATTYGMQESKKATMGLSLFINYFFIL